MSAVFLDSVPTKPSTTSQNEATDPKQRGESKELQEEAFLGSSAGSRGALPDFEALADQYREQSQGKIKPYFFKIKKGGRVSYLLGTFHTLPFSLLHPKSQEIIKKAACLATECEPGGGPEDRLPISSIEDDILRSEGEPNWYGMASPEFQSLIKHAVASKQIDMTPPIPPDKWSFKLLATLAQVAEYYELMGMDNFINGYFRKHKKRIYSLDKVGGEVVLAAMPILSNIEEDHVLMKAVCKSREALLADRKKAGESSIQALESALEHNNRALEAYKAIFKTYISYYKPTSSREFYEECRFYWEGSLDFNEVEHRSEEEELSGLAERNLGWLPKIDQLHHQGEGGRPVFVFGLGHLVGKHYGLLSLLQESGFEIYRMNGQGKFKRYGQYHPKGSLMERLDLQNRTYLTLREQILGVSVDNSTSSLNWMYSAREQMEWAKWKQEYQAEHPDAEERGYGPGALVPI